MHTRTKHDTRTPPTWENSAQTGGGEAGEHVNGVTGTERREQAEQAEAVWCGGEDGEERRGQQGKQHAKLNATQKMSPKGEVSFPALVWIFTYRSEQMQGGT
jgi:hypothetical protein